MGPAHISPHGVREPRPGGQERAAQPPPQPRLLRKRDAGVALLPFTRSLVRPQWGALSRGPAERALCLAPAGSPLAVCLACAGKQLDMLRALDHRQPPSVLKSSASTVASGGDAPAPLTPRFASVSMSSDLLGGERPAIRSMRGTHSGSGTPRTAQTALVLLQWRGKPRSGSLLAPGARIQAFVCPGVVCAPGRRRRRRGRRRLLLHAPRRAAQAAALSGAQRSVRRLGRGEKTASTTTAGASPACAHARSHGACTARVHPRKATSVARPRPCAGRAVVAAHRAAAHQERAAHAVGPHAQEAQPPRVTRCAASAWLFRRPAARPQGWVTTCSLNERL